MFDTMTMTKIVGGFCGMFLIFLLGNAFAESLYHVGAEGHGEGPAQAYSIDTGVANAPAAGAAAVAGPPFAEVYAKADAAAGEKLFKACKACHKLEKGANSTGPYLFGVVNRKVDTAEGYSYSGALEKVVDVWSPEHLYGFIENPKGYAPGTKMGYKGMANAEDRANLIAYLATVGG